MDNRRKSVIFLVASVILIASTVPIDADPASSHVAIILPLLCMGLLLFLAGYFAGRANNEK